MNLSIHLRKYIKLFARRLWILVVCTLVGFAYAYYKAQKTPNTFRAYSRLGIKPQLQTRFDDPVRVKEMYAEFHEAQLQYMRSSRGRVAEEMTKYRSTNSLVQPRLISADPGVAAGSTFELVVLSNDFDYARRYAEIWVREFLKFKAEIKAGAVDSKVVETRNSIDHYTRLLEQSRAEMLQFLKTNNIGMARETGAAAQELLNRLVSEHTDKKTERQLLENKTAEEIAETLLRQRQEKPNAADGNAGLKLPEIEGFDPANRFTPDSPQSRLELSLRRKRDELKAESLRLLPKHPHLQKIQKDIQEMEAEAKIYAEMMEAKRKEWLTSMERLKQARIASLKLDEKAYEEVIVENRRKVQDAINLENTYKKLEDDERRVKEILDNLNRKLIAIDQVNTNEEIITPMEEGAGSPAPISPDRPKMVMNGTLAGFGLGLALIFLLHRLDDRLELAEDIEEELQEPVLGQVPQQDIKDLKNGRLLITHLEQHNMFAESIRGVRSSIMFGSPDKPKKVLIVTSAVPGDGKTTFTVNFAATLANAGNRVLLVDCDLRRGNIHGYFELNREPGLTDVLAGQVHWSDVTHDTVVPTLKVINTGRLPGNPGELLISPAMDEFVSEASEEYDHILFDCPPLTAIDDTFCLLNLADGLLFIVKAGQTSMRFAKNALAAVRQRGANILGVVLNGITTDHPSYYYNYYYHAYYNKEAKNQGEAGTLKPARQMAQRRHRRMPSIDAEAHARSGHPLSSAEIAAEEQKKAELFKSRRARRQPQSPGEAQTADEPNPGDDAGRT